MAATNANATERRAAGTRPPRKTFRKGQATLLLLTASLGLGAGATARVLRQAHQDAVLAAAQAARLSAVRASALTTPRAAAPQPPAATPTWIPQPTYRSRAFTRRS